MIILGVDPGLSNEDLAYTAGLFDGEGCVSIYQHHGFLIMCQILMTTPDPLYWLQSKFGGQLRQHHAKHLLETNRKDQWYWRVVTQQARNFLSAIRPWLRIKHQQADLILSLKFYPRGGQTSPLLRPTEADRAARDHAVTRLRELNKRGRSRVV